MVFSEGELYCLEENGLFYCWKILQSDFSGGNLLVRTYWPEAEKPFGWNSPELSIQRACEEIDPKRLEKAEQYGSEDTTETDLDEIRMFLHIKEGLAKRTSLLPEIMSRASVHFEAGNFIEAIHLYTEAASYARNNPEIFLKRGECYRRLGRESEANADFNHADSLVR